MAVIKCKMCGGDLNLIEGASTAECEFCGSVQTVPKVDDEKKITLFARANRLRSACEFDKAAGIYESIVADFPEEAEAYWGLVLCKYGIEYVDDPATGKKIPTCHRSSFDSILEDSDFEQALENADLLARRVYREEAKQIEEIRKGIIAVSNNEAPYDIFICYKETDENGGRTLDSVLAQDIYDALTEKGYRVFFSRITLEDKLGQEYEPYIFAALNSAKIMLAFGTDYEYFNAVWVKNEWSRFLKLMAKDKSKHLIPCFKGIDAYDMPKEFARLQAQDLGKVGAVQDLLRGIGKLMPKQEQETVVVQTAMPNSGAMVMRGQFALEDGDFVKASEYFERALDQNPQDGAAYLGKVLAALHLSKASQIDEYFIKLHDDKDYDRAIRFSDPATAQMLRDIRERAHKKYLVKCVTVGIKKYARNREREERALAERITQQKREEEERIALQKREEEERLAKQKQEEEARVARMQRLNSIHSQLRNPSRLIGAAYDFTVGVKADGTVVAVGDNDKGRCDVNGWYDIVAVCASYNHTVGLKMDGTVVAVGENEYGQCDVSDLHDIVAVSAGCGYTVGLKADGTVVATDSECDVSSWQDIVAVSAYFHTVGLKSDGTVVAAGDNENGECDVSDWQDIVAVSAGEYHTVGLKADGTVVAVGSNGEGACDVSGWQNIVAVSAGDEFTVGLKSDGTVVAAGLNRGGCDVGRWQNIVAVSAGGHHTVGLKADGTVVTAGFNIDGRYDVSGWRLFRQLDTLEQEQKEGRAAARIAREKREKEARIARERRNQGLCQHCGGAFKGLFGKKCTSCGKPKDY